MTRERQDDPKGELQVLEEWERLLQLCLAAPFVNLHRPGKTPHRTIEAFICQITRGQARIWWESPSADMLEGTDRVIEIRRGKVHYGLLGLAPGYLASTTVPGIAHCLASLCGVLTALVEYEVFIDNQLAHLPSVCTIGPLIPSLMTESVSVAFENGLD